MDTPLDAVRAEIGLRPADPASQRLGRSVRTAGAPPSLSAIARAGRYSVEALSTRSRLFVSGTAVLATAVALTHQLLAGAMADAYSGPWSAARAVLVWPWPLTQTIVSAVGAGTLVVIALMTDGYLRVSREMSWPLLIATAVAILGAGPMLLVCAITAVVYAVIIVIGVVIFIAVIAILIGLVS